MSATRSSRSTRAPTSTRRTRRCSERPPVGEPSDRAAVVRRMLEALSTGLIAGLRDEDVRARYRAEFASQATDDFELVPMGTEAGPLLTPFHGVDGVLAFWDEWLAPWQGDSFELETLVEG